MTHQCVQCLCPTGAKQAGRPAIAREDSVHSALDAGSPGPASRAGGGSGRGGGSEASLPPPAHPADSAINSWVVPRKRPAAQCVEAGRAQDQPSSRTMQLQLSGAQSADPPQDALRGGAAADSGAAVTQTRKRAAAAGAAGMAPAKRRQSQGPAAADAAVTAPATPSQHGPPVAAEAAATAAVAAPPQQEQPANVLQANVLQQAEPVVGPLQPAPQPAALPTRTPAGACHSDAHLFRSLWRLLRQ